jgi:transcriptional regulator with XRE-family HTH domain
VPERPVLFWIAEACKQIRKDTNHNLAEIAGAAGVDQSTIWRFENHRTRSPKKLHEITVAYELVTGVPAPKLLARAAGLAREGELEES